MPRKHSDNGPSTLRRRELCPASYRMEKGLPDIGNEQSRTGTRLHACVERLLRGSCADLLQEFADLDAQQWDNVRRCAEQAAQLGWEGARSLPEHYLDLRWFHPSIGGGTPDLIILEDFARAIVVDFKFGHKRVQPAAENLQLACYAVGVRHDFDLESVQVCVIQPALGLVDLADCRAETIERARDAASKALDPEARCMPGPEQCAYCKASGRCPAQQSIICAPTVDRATVELLPMLTISEFLALWEDRDIEGIVGAMKQRLLEACLTGYEDERWKLGHGRGSRIFVENAEVKLLELCRQQQKDPQELYTRPQLRSVAQIETVLGKSKAVKSALDVLVHRIEGKPKLERKADAAHQLHA